MTKEDLANVLAEHVRYLRGEIGAKRADLRGANLRGVNLRGVNLRRADLRGADLRGADLRGADLRGVNLRRADLYGADLGGANLGGVNLGGANLGGANLGGANLYGAKNAEPWILRSQIVPQDGAFRVFKKLRNNIVAVLEIPEGAARVGGTLGRKCRASEAIVLGFLGAKDEPLPHVVEGYSQHDPSFLYRIGETVKPTNEFCHDPLQECAAGIHFFLSYEEAAEYC